MRKWLFILCLLAFCLKAHAEPAEPQSGGIPHPEQLTDLQSVQTCEPGAYLRLEQEEGIGSVYLVFDREYETVLLSDGTAEVPVAVDGILHRFVDLTDDFEQLPTSITVTFPEAAELNAVFAFAPGQAPDWVQKWERLPDGEAELLLFSAHGDDEQLFFAGLLPWYSEKQIQVVYFTDHRNLTPIRVHEMLNGLWNVGVRNYPVFGPYDDYYTFSLRDAYAHYAQEGHTEEALLGFVVEQLRRYRPLVAVGHDLNGEYGHGMHKLCAELLTKAAAISADAEQYPQLAAQYGVWDVPKTYLHLYSENPITMDWDIPMDAFGGRTAYEVSRDLGFAAHESQQKDFAWYFRGYDRAVDIAQYPPTQFGLYRTTVGEDTAKDDFFENLGPKPEPIIDPPPPVTIPSLPEPVPSSPEPQRPSAQRGWIAIPAVGTVVLTLLTATLNVPRKNNF